MGKILGDPICKCGRDCAGAWSRDFVITWRTHLFDSCTSRKDLLRFLFTVLSGMYDPEMKKFYYKVNNVRCCGIAFERFWNITNFTRRHVIDCIRNRLPVSSPHGNSLIEHNNFKTRLVKNWLTNFCLVCEQQPDSNEVHTVERYKKIDIFDVMISEMRYSYSQSDLPSSQLFYQVWKKDFPHLKIPKECRLGRCDECSTLTESIRTSSGKVRASYLAKKLAHNRDCNAEREEMTKLHSRSIANPSEWTCLCTDWSNPHFMPHLARQPKGWMTKKRLKYHVFGIANTGTKEVFLYPHLEFWTHDANLHMSFLFCYLHRLRQQGRLGRNLMLQMDNCWRDNKNQWFFGFLFHLVNLGWFQSVELLYLRPGHSHDTVDRACFSPLGKTTRSLYSYWIPEQFWDEFVMRGFARQSVKAQKLENMCVFDWKSWLDPVLRQPLRHSFQRAFLITMQDDMPVLFFKKNLTRTLWRGLKSAPDHGLQIVSSIPESVPDVIPPTLLEPETYEDISTLSALPPMFISYWLNFGDNQFPDDFATLPDDIGADFWCENVDSVLSSVDTSGDDDPFTDDERDIHVVNHPRLIDHADLRKGVIIAVRPNENHYEENPDEIEALFWLAQIVSHKRRGQTWSYKVCWFEDVTANNPNVPSKYVLDDSTTAYIPYTSILYHKIELTQRNNLKQNDYNKIMAICEA